MGRPAAGYKEKICILTEEAAKALILVQNELDTLESGYCLKIFDAYRPTEAVADFVRWAEEPGEKMKDHFYPTFTKPELFKFGYIAKQSSHSRGSTVDLTIASLATTNADPTELDMGTIFDFFNEKAHTDNPYISDTAKKNRLFLKEIMEKHGFKNYPLEWWHFTLENEPFPETYFEFPVQ